MMNQISLMSNKILIAREERALLRNSIAKTDCFSLSISLNIPGYPKSNDVINEFFEQIVSEIKIYSEANRIIFIHENKILQTDEAGDFFIVPFAVQNKNIQTVKKITEKFESNHTLGRLIDIDIFDISGQPISSGKEKACFFCGKHSAISCMRNKRHSYSEIRHKIQTEITDYLHAIKKEKTINKLSSFALKAIIHELILPNKPGLVNVGNNGIHTDMNYLTFINSASAINPYLSKFCELAYDVKNYEDALPKIREVGLQAEKAMFQITNNVNTHKGLIFLIGISLFSATKTLIENNEFSDEKFRDIVMKISKNIVRNELENNNKSKTNGEKVFLKYGINGAGARYEAESGFETVYNTALPYFQKKINAKIYNNTKKFNTILYNGLLKIISENNDTNILYRSDLETLKTFQRIAKKNLSKENTHKELCDFCINKNISPGGSADLLAVSLFIYFVKNEK